MPEEKENEPSSSFIPFVAEPRDPGISMAFSNELTLLFFVLEDFLSVDEEESFTFLIDSLVAALRIFFAPVAGDNSLETFASPVGLTFESYSTCFLKNCASARVYNGAMNNNWSVIKERE